MSFVQKFPKVASWCLQKCPLCNEDKFVVTQGIVIQDKGLLSFPDRGYSFCNCKNIWFTDWDNIDHRTIHNNESKEVLHYYLSDMGLIHNDPKDNSFYTAFVFILNKGIGRNYVFVEGDAPETKAEFERLGFVIDETRENYDLIWSYHTLEHEKEPLVVLKEYYNRLNRSGIIFVAMPDPFFINFDNINLWGHWLLREHHIMWDMDSFCDEAEKIGFKVLLKNRNTSIKVCRDMHVILEKP